ncbi:MAG: DUF2079 domain-containing protein [Thermoplasmataceae archaeon]
MSIILIYTLVFSYFSYLRYLDFFTSNWDLGINLQKLSTFSLKNFLFEAGDYETYGVLSSLEIHITLIAIPYALFFKFFPSPMTLFLTQSFMLSLSSIPLFYICKNIGIGRKTIYGVILVFLLSFPIISSEFFDFHWMSFIPVEYFTVFYLLLRKRYAWVAVVIALGSVTLEVFPFLSLSILFYFFLEAYGYNFKINLTKLFNKSFFPFYFLAIFTLGMYFALRYVEFTLVPTYLNNAVGAANSKAHFLEPFIPTLSSLMNTLGGLKYWLILYCTVGFIAFLYPKHIILVLPWFYETVFVVPNFTDLYAQYAFIAIPPLIIGFIYSLSKIEKNQAKYEPLGKILLLILVPATIIIALDGILVIKTIFAQGVEEIIFVVYVVALVFFMRKKYLHKPNVRQIKSKLKKATSPLVIIFVLLLIFNIVASPLNPENSYVANDNGYAFKYYVNPEFVPAEKIANLIPHNVTILASDNLFPLVASHRNAYSIYWESLSEIYAYYGFHTYMNLNNSKLLFNYIFIDQAQFSYIPLAVISEIHNNTLYGLYAILETNLSYPGNISLYKENYSGQPLYFYS